MSNRPRRPSGTSNTLDLKDALLGVASVLLGLLVLVLGFFALMMWIDARNARHSANQSNASVATSMGSTANANLGALTSFAGAAPADADALATAHHPYPAAMPPAYAGAVANVHLVLSD